MSQKYLVTGADGFIGSHLVRRLSGRAETFALVRSTASLSRLRSPEHDIRLCAVDIRDRDQVRETVVSLRPTAVVHLAAISPAAGRDTPADVMAVNVLGALNVLDAIREIGSVERAVFVGSWYEYGAGLVNGADRRPRPASPYGVSKLAATLLVQSLASESNVPAVVVRPFQVYGPAEPPHRLLPQILRSAQEHVPVRLWNPAASRDWVYVDDVVDAFEAALQSTYCGEPIDIGTGTVTSVKTVAGIFASLVRGTIVDEGAASAVPADASDATLSGAADTRAAEVHFGWKARYDLTAGLQRTVDWHVHEHGPLAAT